MEKIRGDSWLNAVKKAFRSPTKDTQKSSSRRRLEDNEQEEEEKNFPRFKPENLEHNQKIFERVNEMAAKKGCTPSQLALAWVHHCGNDVVPIPGTTKIANLNQNIGALSVKLTPEEMAELESYASADVVKGERHAFMSMTWINSETPPLSSLSSHYCAVLLSDLFSGRSTDWHTILDIFRRNFFNFAPWIMGFFGEEIQDRRCRHEEICRR
ncbi:hypothetical protein HYC85_012239 [Camellia sinensis]|uniref:NADP-dependent oxidoreductase domain-containing protein n=1 Tax=Camellia sinensis TaxID=4442 RepID=A0A7J7HEM2_CAMSI|nr:hypothetical protein HYC85_012239 [Camellia sinensis]